LLVDPLTGDILLLTRDRAQTGWTDIYLYPIESQAPGQLRTVQYITSIASSVEIKGGDVSRDGLWIILRRHGSANAPGWLYPRSSDTGIESAFNTAPCLVQFASEPQGEAVAFASDLSGFYAISEGAAQPIYFAGRLTAPSAPDNGAGKAISTSQVNLTWRDNANNEASFRIERSSDGASFEPPLFLAANSVSYNDSGLLPGRTYWYRLTAWNNAGSSAPLLMSTKTFETVPTLPAAPIALTITSVSITTIGLSWMDNSNNEQGFTIERSTDNRVFSPVSSTGPNVNTFPNTGLQANKLYYFRVRAFNSAGNSAYSNTVSTRTAKR
jgi:predicted phage tail protein